MGAGGGLRGSHPKKRKFQTTIKSSLIVLEPGTGPWLIKIGRIYQRIARRDNKAFFSDQCKEIKENNRMGKTRDLFNAMWVSTPMKGCSLQGPQELALKPALLEAPQPCPHAGCP